MIMSVVSLMSLEKTLFFQRFFSERSLKKGISSKTMCLGIDILKPKKEVVYI